MEEEADKKMSSNIKLHAKLLILTFLLGSVAFVSNGLPSVWAATSVQGVEVEAFGDGGYGLSVSDTQGLYNITNFLETGTYTVTASAIGYIDTEVEDVSVTAGSETADVDILMNVSAGVSGTVTDAISSTPLTGIYVSAVNENGDMDFGSVAMTDETGKYAIITNLATGNCNVTTFIAYGHISKEITGISVTAGEMTENVDIALDRSASIKGTVTDSVSMAPLPDITVLALDSNGDYISSATTNSTGEYVLNTNLATGTYNVTILYPSNYFSKTVADVAVEAGSEYTVDFSLDPSGAISGTITNAENGQPVTGAVVTVTSNGFSGYAVTDEEGDYLIADGLGTGTYTVFAISGTSFNQTTGVSVTEGSETSGIDLELTLPPSGTITGRVTDSLGDPVESAQVSAEGLTSYGSNTTDANGDYTINAGLGTGTYNVTVTATGFVTQTETDVIVIEDQTTEDVDFQLETALSGSISGQITTEGTAIPDFPSNLFMLGIILAMATIAIAVGKIELSKRKQFNQP